jgi:hypothetical protein
MDDVDVKLTFPLQSTEEMEKEATGLGTTVTGTSNERVHPLNEVVVKVYTVVTLGVTV